MQSLVAKKLLLSLAYRVCWGQGCSEQGTLFQQAWHGLTSRCSVGAAEVGFSDSKS